MINYACLKQYIMILEKHISTSITDSNGVITYVSPAFCSLTGYKKEELIGRKHTLLRHPDMSDSIYQKLWETIAQGNPWQGRIKNCTKDKISYWIDIYIEPIFQNRVIIGYQAIEQNITKETFFEALAKLDNLTGLSNRLAIEEFVQFFMHEVHKYQKIFSIIMVDVDDFKQVNDMYGHQTGDEVLKKISEILQSLIRSNDRIGRWGGEEFLIVLPQTSHVQAKELAERLRVGVASYKFKTIGHKTASFGVAEIEKKDTIKSLIERADKALYISKKIGKNIVT
ncbi:MAG: diguanylate cyclase [Thiovulaceae bacterium]|nr:diguanylate cyclase [Sulfurimonadaceae bacterium]